MIDTVVYFILNPSLVSIFRHPGYQGGALLIVEYSLERGEQFISDGNRHFGIPFRMLGTNVLASQISKEIFAKFTLGRCADSQTNPILIASKFFLNKTPSNNLLLPLY